MPVGAVQIKNVPEDLHDALRRRAAHEGRSVSDHVLGLIRKDLALPSMTQWLAELHQDEPVELPPGAVVEALGEGRSEREEQLYHAHAHAHAHAHVRGR